MSSSNEMSDEALALQWEAAASEAEMDMDMAAPAASAQPAASAPEKGVSDENVDRNLDAVLGIPVDMQVVLGSATMPVASLLKLGRGAVIPLDHRVGEPVDIVVNGRTVARGEIVVVEDDNSRFGVSLTEIVGAKGNYA
ncbi:Flagellar motor switch protein fliN [Pseudovibrio sp. FO-BEG1]|uniref:Flagellar motor switch protein FliN n=3 Tax=Stappiaceae TaxID=2821832 RepID=A0A1I6Y7D6_9HYPH|nr:MULTISPECIES: flagellar motor switch protein FliN [Pseudovibrio]AEV37106.1 Flagellar motor switch protein fliN [Pseudovibrio sp. FO-BEG1]EEA92646.1 flagellar motor switch protein FliN [Pseudovibrio sp. JE062]QUS57424.1 flagellar motor switch protein FliN [Pseudovibrio brasiliensis]SFT46034.1 flagellar motor switch protein FliN/FliY [Pseudovibrio denitrificans]